MGGWAPFCEAGDGGNAFPEVPPRPSVHRPRRPRRAEPQLAGVEMVERARTTSERHFSYFPRSSPLPLLILLWAEVSDDGSDDGLHVEVFNIELQMLIFQNPAWEIYN